jgi:hypothetical protein
MLRQVRPADSLQGNLLFDVQPARDKLRLTDDTEQHTAFIDLPLNFVPDTPDLPEATPPRK